MRPMGLSWLSRLAILWAFDVIATPTEAGQRTPPGRGSSQEQTQRAPWHVKQADIRFPLTIQKDWNLPPDVYLADLEPVGSEGLQFDAGTKKSIWPEQKKPPGKKRKKTEEKGRQEAIQPVRPRVLSAVFTIRPEYRWLICSHRGGRLRVMADGEEIYSDAVWSRQTASTKLAIPTGTRRLRLEVSGTTLTRAGFSMGPRAAKAQVCLPGMNPAGFAPLVYTATGKQVGCDIVWARDGEPMTVLFDCSSGETDYLLYPVDRRHNIRPLAWKRGGGMVLESRYVDKYDASVGSFEGFQRLWKQSDHIAGRMLVHSPFITGMPPFPPTHSSRAMFRAPQGAPLVLSRCVGIMHGHDGGTIRLYSRFRSGGYLRIDGRMVIQAGGTSNREDDTEGEIRPKRDGKDVHLSRGPHLVELCQYGSFGAHYAAFSVYGASWAKLPKFVVHADTTAKPLECRDKDKLLVAAVWPSICSRDFLQALGRWPAGNMLQWPMKAHLSKPMTGVTFRWRFPDGHSAFGQEIQHTFFEEGVVPVTVEALRPSGQNVLASTTVRIKVDVNRPKGNWGYRRFNDELTRRAGEFGTTMPIAHLLNIHAWAYQNHRRPMQKLTAEAIAKRLDEVLKERESQPDYLVWLGKALSTPPESAHDAAMRLLRAASQSLEPGTMEHREAALAVCDLLTTVYDKPLEAIQLAERTRAQKDTVALHGEWEVAADKVFHEDLRKINLKDIMGSLVWEKHLGLGYQSTKGGKWKSIWLRKRAGLAHRDNSKPLYLHLGRMFKDGMIYWNGQPICEPWECPGGMVGIPGKSLRPDINELLIHFRPLSPEHDTPRYFLSGPGEDRLDREFVKAKAVAMLSMGKVDEATALLKKLTVARDAAQSEPKSAVVGWYVLGPFEGGDAAGPGRVPVTGVEDIDLEKPVNGKQWQKLEDRCYQGSLVDLTSFVPIHSSVLLYKSFHAPEPFDSEFEGSGGKPLRLWLNGTALLGNIGRRGKAVSKRIARVNAGKNEIVALVTVAIPRYSQGFRLSMTNPESEISEVALASQLRKAKFWANDGNPDHAEASFEFLEKRLDEQPTLRTNLDVMETMVRALVGREDHRRALLLSKRLLGVGVPEIYERALLLGQVQSMLGLGEIDEARKVYKKMNDAFPYSEETLRARETIIKWVMDKKKGEKN